MIYVLDLMTIHAPKVCQAVWIAALHLLMSQHIYARRNLVKKQRVDFEGKLWNAKDDCDCRNTEHEGM